MQLECLAVAWCAGLDELWNSPLPPYLSDCRKENVPDSTFVAGTEIVQFISLFQAVCSVCLTSLSDSEANGTVWFGIEV